MSNLKIILAALFVLLGSHLFGSDIFVEASTPVFTEPRLGSKLIAVQSRALDYHYSDSRLFIMKKHPFGRPFRFYKIKLGNNKSGWVSPRLRLLKKNGRAVIDVVKSNSYGYLMGMIFSLLVSGLIVFYLFVDSFFSAVLEKLSLRKLSQMQIIISSVCLLTALRYAQNFAMLEFGNEIFTLTPDGAIFFRMARDVLEGNILVRWDRMVGVSFLYIPVVWVTGAENYAVAGWYVALVNVFVLMPACSAILFFVFKKLLKSWQVSLIAGILWILIPFFWFGVQIWSKQVFFMTAGLPEFGFSWRGYGMQQMLGFNNLVDAISAVSVFGAVALAVFARGKYTTLVLASAVFGFACLVRINNLMFAPVIAFFFWDRWHVEWKNYINCLLSILAACGAFLAVFGCQLLLDKYHFDSFWTLPYSITGAASGFEFNCISRNIRFLFGCNHLYIVMGLAGLILCKNKTAKVAFALWIIPTIILFAGFVGTETDSHRYLVNVFCAMFAIFVFWVSEQKLSGKDLLLWTGGMLALLLFYNPYNYSFPLIAEKVNVTSVFGVVAFVFAMVVNLWTLRKQLDAQVTSLVFIVLYVVDVPYLYLILFIAVLLWTGYLFVLDVWTKMLSRREFWNLSK
jgi:hypothetical protein